MDALADFLPLLFVLVYFLLGARRRKAHREKQQQILDSADPTIATQNAAKQKRSTPFQEFIRQMEEAMQEASGEPVRAAPEAETVSAPPAVPVPEARALPPERPSAFHAMGSFERELSFEQAKRPPHEIHSFGPDSPFSEEAFEHLARGLDITEHAPGHLAASPHQSLGSPHQTPTVSRAELAPEASGPEARPGRPRALGDLQRALGAATSGQKVERAARSPEPPARGFWRQRRA